MSSRFSKLRQALDERRDEENAREEPDRDAREAEFAVERESSPGGEQKARASTRAAQSARAKERSTTEPTKRPEHAGANVLRNGLSMLPEEWQMLDELRNSYFGATRRIVRMNVIIRAAIRALDQAPTDALLRAIEQTPELKPGRKPAKTKNTSA